MKRVRDETYEVKVSAANLRNRKRRVAVVRQVFTAAALAPPGEFEIPKEFPANTMTTFKYDYGTVRTLFELALYKRDVPLLEQCVARGAKVNMYSALWHVVLYDFADGLQWFLERFAALLPELLQWPHGLIMAVQCARQGCKGTLQLLHKAGVDMIVKPADGQTPLQAALYNIHETKNVDVACWLLETVPAVAVVRQPNGDTPAIEAARYGQLDILAALRTAHADMDAKSRNGDTAILAAAKAGKWDAVRWLLAHYPAIKTQTRRQRTTVASYAVEANALDVLQTLHARNIPLHTRNIAIDKDHNTLLISAAVHGYVDMVRFLASCRGMPLDARAKTYGTTAAFTAALNYNRNDGITMLQALHDHGAALHLIDKSAGNTILHCAAGLNYVDMMLWILDAVPQLTGFEKNLHGETAVDILKLNGYRYAATTFETAAQRRQDQQSLRWSAARAAWCAAAASAATV
jgi:ankyrin repeat protein